MNPALRFGHFPAACAALAMWRALGTQGIAAAAYGSLIRPYTLQLPKALYRTGSAVCPPHTAAHH